MMLGLALGETVGSARGTVAPTGPLWAGVGTQLACFTAEGVVRAQVRNDHKGICYAPGVVLHAYCRWAYLQGVETRKMLARWNSPGDRPWPDGWLAGVPTLAERRGSAPATVAALSRVDEGEEAMATPSRGAHALTRSLPVAVTGVQGIALVDALAGLTHGDRAARGAAVHATLLTRHCLTHPIPHRSPYAPFDGVLREALDAGLSALPSEARSLTEQEHDRLRAAFHQAVEAPADPAHLARLAPDATAPAALLGGIYAAASFPHPADLRSAMAFAATAPAGDSVACVTGALLGAAHGAESLPTDLVTRHELAWVLDTLARDLVLQFDDPPSGSEYVEGWDPHWWNRYPGW
jgi:ADP-ribosylglycohydrolase